MGNEECVRNLEDIIMDLDTSYELIMEFPSDNRVYYVSSKLFGLSLQDLFDTFFKFFSNSDECFCRNLAKEEVDGKSGLELLEYCYSNKILTDDTFYECVKKLFLLSDIYLSCDSKVSFYMEHRQDFLEVLNRIQYKIGR